MARSPWMVRQDRSVTCRQIHFVHVAICKWKVVIYLFLLLLLLLLLFRIHHQWCPQTGSSSPGCHRITPSKIFLNPRIVSFSGTYWPFIPVNCSATEKLWIINLCTLRALDTVSLSSSESSSIPMMAIDILQFLITLTALSVRNVLPDNALRLLYSGDRIRLVEIQRIILQGKYPGWQYHAKVRWLHPDG